MEEKKPIQSATIIVNSISLVAMLIQSQVGFVINAEAQAAILTVINLALRFKTSKPIKL